MRVHLCVLHVCRLCSRVIPACCFVVFRQTVWCVEDAHKPSATTNICGCALQQYHNNKAKPQPPAVTLSDLDACVYVHAYVPACVCLRARVHVFVCVFAFSCVGCACVRVIVCVSTRVRTVLTPQPFADASLLIAFVFMVLLTCLTFGAWRPDR